MKTVAWAKAWKPSLNLRFSVDSAAGMEANVGLGSLVGRVPARKSGGFWFNSHPSQYFFVQPQFLRILISVIFIIVYIYNPHVSLKSAHLWRQSIEYVGA